MVFRSSVNLQAWTDRQTVSDLLISDVGFRIDSSRGALLRNNLGQVVYTVVRNLFVTFMSASSIIWQRQSQSQKRCFKPASVVFKISVKETKVLFSLIPRYTKIHCCYR